MTKAKGREFELLLEGSEVPYWSYQDIMSRYVFAASFAKDKVVLEIGCGSGYGASYLAKKGSRRVVGGDISEESMGYCRRYSAMGNLEFVRLDATKLPFSDSSFDVVVSFELIEHLKQYEVFLSECSRVIKDGGCFICSTPNKEITSPLFNKPLCRFHVKEFSPSELRSLVQRYFTSVVVYGQRYLDRKSRFEWRMRSLGGYVFERVFADRVIAKKLGSFVFRRDYRMVRVGEDDIDRSLDPISEVRVLTSERSLTPGGIIIVATKRKQL